MGKVNGVTKKMVGNIAFSGYQGQKPKGNGIESMIKNAPNTTKPYAKADLTSMLDALVGKQAINSRVAMGSPVAVAKTS